MGKVIWRLSLLSSLVLLGLGCTRGDDSSSGNGSSNGSGSSSGVAFLGSYATCAQGVVTESGGYLMPSEFQQGTTLTLAQRGDVTTATYNQNGTALTFDFEATTNVTASLSASSPTFPGVAAAVCVLGIGDEEPFPADLAVTAGSLVYESGAVFVSFSGVLSSPTARCSTTPAPATAWIACTGADATKSPAPVEATATSGLSTGQYACMSQVDATYTTTAGTLDSTDGGSGILAIESSGSAFTALYTGDATVTGALDFLTTTNETARLTAGQTVDTACETIDADGTPVTSALQAMSVPAGGLVDDRTITISAIGIHGASSQCPGETTIATLVCDL